MAIESISQRPLAPVQEPPRPTVAEKGKEEEARAAQSEPPPPPPPPAESGRGQNVDIFA